MTLQTKNMIRISIAFGVSALTFLALGLVGGCAQSRNSAAGSWDWSPPAKLQAGNAGSSSAVIVAPGRQDSQFYVYAYDQMPEYDRRDGSLSIRSSDPYLGQMGYPQEQRPTLDRQRSYYSGRNAERYTYPTVGSDRRSNYRNRRYR